MLRLQNICKEYKVAAGSVQALKGVSLSFRNNEFVCILGPSGCGKTTLLNIIGGLDQYTSGDLVIQGKSTKDFKDRDWDVYRNHRIGFIFQSYNLIPHQTVLGNVELALTIAGIGKEERRARAQRALERVGLGAELDKRPNQLSGGQCQRVAIARALVNEPDILLADEPTGALDSKTSVQIMELIKEIAGERLVIMVTHNPELAEQYASRIVRLSDGLVESDSNPYSEEEEEKESLAQDAAAAESQLRPQPKKEKKARAKMGLLTSLALSGRNLLTKKGRTILTSVAGSIGIISVCLVLALSSGFNNYIKRTEEDMLSYYPVQITESAYDMMAIMQGFNSASDMPDLSELDDKVYVNSFLTGIAQGMTVKNNISQTYLDYIKEMDESWYYAIQYGYGAALSDNLFTSATTMDGNNGDAEETRYMSLADLKTFYISELTQREETAKYAELAYLVDYLGAIVGKMPGTDLSSDSYGEYVLSQYDVVTGSFPQSKNEAVLVIGENNDVTDLTLVQLGLLSEKTFISVLSENGIEGDYLSVPFEEITEHPYVLYFNDSVYSKNENAGYAFEYHGEKQSLDATEQEGIPIRISGILRLKEGLTYGCLDSGLYLTETLITDYIAQNMQSEIVKWMNDKTNLTFGYHISPAQRLNSYYFEASVGGQTYYLNSTNDTALRYLGGNNMPNSVSLYLRDFTSKNAVIDYLDAWNTKCENGESYNGVTLSEAEKVTYTDTVGLLMGMVQTMLDVITYVLVAFTAISLVVSSVMIGIITYVSVVERVKEIGVLRSLGARKRDIKNLFNAETFIIGLAAGLIGVAVTYILTIPINLIISSLTGIVGIASLPVLTAFVMVIISVALTLISGLIPASAAAKKDPVIALRTE